MAVLAGRVQGVVVQISALTSFDLTASCWERTFGNLTRGNLTKAAVTRWFSSYSSSASARAVFEDGDQWTGLFCL